MARIDRYKQYSKGAIYHIFNRGVGKNKIFLDKEDYRAYIIRIQKYKAIHKIEFLNYNLMDNHIHFTACQLSDVPIYKFMQSLHTSYGHYFNKRHKRVGHLFQDRFKQRIVNDQGYFLWLSAYINGNAAIHKIVKDPKDWPYSSYLDYAGLRQGTVCNIEKILEFFSDKNQYLDFVADTIIECQNKKEAINEAEFE